MDEPQREQALPKNLHCFLILVRVFSILPLSNLASQLATIGILHDDVQRGATQEGVKEADDVGMRQLTEHSNLRLRRLPLSLYQGAQVHLLDYSEWCTAASSF